MTGHALGGGIWALGRALGLRAAPSAGWARRCLKGKPRSGAQVLKGEEVGPPPRASRVAAVFPALRQDSIVLMFLECIPRSWFFTCRAQSLTATGR